MPRTIGISQFRNSCSRLIDQLARDRQPLTITRRGKPVAVLVPAAKSGERKPLFGAMSGTLLRYDDPFAPAAIASSGNPANGVAG